MSQYAHPQTLVSTAWAVEHLNDPAVKFIEVAGHIPGTRNIPWAKTVNEDGTFKSEDELRQLYVDAG